MPKRVTLRFVYLTEDFLCAEQSVKSSALRVGTALIACPKGRPRISNEPTMLSLKFDKFFIVLLLTSLQFKWLRSDISSILFPFNTAIGANQENKNAERNLSLRNRYQPDHPANRDQYGGSNNLLNKLASDRPNLRNPKVDRPLVVPDLYCEKEEWLCHDKLRCIPRAQICDSQQNCIDRSDVSAMRGSIG